MVRITYFCPGTSEDNEHGLASGWRDSPLTPKGLEEAKRLGELIQDQHFDVVFCSDTHRARNTAYAAFGDKIPIIEDPRLRDCNYGEHNGSPVHIVEAMQISAVSTPYPGGESYMDVQKRVSEFLDMLRSRYDGKSVAVIAHRAVQLALEVILQDEIQWADAFDHDWRKAKNWQPGWGYVA